MTLSATADAPTVLVTAVGKAEGSRGAAAALACAAADIDLATLLIDVGGKVPRPALLASTAARHLEERMTSHIPQAHVAARGQLCQLRVAADPEGLEAASAAVTVARGAVAAIHLPPSLLQPVLSDGRGLKPSGVLLCAAVAPNRALLALVVRDLMARGLDVGVLKRRLNWVAERRAFFGALPADTAGGLPKSLLSRLLDQGPPASAIPS